MQPRTVIILAVGVTTTGRYLDLLGTLIHALAASVGFTIAIAVFAAFPYLYDGDAAYEADYLREFAAAPDGVTLHAEFLRQRAAALFK